MDDGFARLGIDGRDATSVLARLVVVDLAFGIKADQNFVVNESWIVGNRGEVPGFDKDRLGAPARGAARVARGRMPLSVARLKSPRS